MYRLATIHFVTNRQRERDDCRMPTAYHTVSAVQSANNNPIQYEHAPLRVRCANNNSRI